MTFTAGGALTARNSSSYIWRESDEGTIGSILNSEYVLLVEPRQQGKTSLINRLVGHPRLFKTVFAYIDLSTLDYQSPQKWYESLSNRIVNQLSRHVRSYLEIERPYDHTTWRDFLSAVATKTAAEKSQIVIALDEIGGIDVPSHTAFYSVLRDIYNSRQVEPEFEKLVFVLSGAFHPRNLIADTRISPFNIAQRMRLPDFTKSEVFTLAERGPWSKQYADSLANEVHYWTDGQPYLTQLLLLAMARTKAPNSVELCIDFLLSDDNNVTPVFLRLQNSEPLLDYVLRIYSGQLIRYSPQVNRVQSELELIGVIKSDSSGYCKIRNKIYERYLHVHIIDRPQDEREFGVPEIDPMPAIANGKATKVNIPPEVIVQAAHFLFDIGRWAANELGERWSVKQSEDRNQEDLNLSGDSTDRESILVSLLQEQEQRMGTESTRLLVDTINQKHKLIREWQQMKLDNEEEYNRQMISRSTLRLRQDELDSKIKTALLELRSDLYSVGLVVHEDAS